MAELIIFDCDGTLVDSETLYNSITSELLTEMGFPEYTTERCIELFAGQSWSTIKGILEDKHGAGIPQDLVQRYIQTANVRMERDLTAAPEAHTVVESLAETHSTCVASNGERGNVIKSLTQTGLITFFDEDRIFTKAQVAQPKPAPDLFWFTAEQMGFATSQCLVIEDSPAGVTAAVAAGMDVIGFTGCAHDQERQAYLLKDAGATHITDQLIHIAKHL